VRWFRRVMPGARAAGPAIANFLRAKPARGQELRIKETIGGSKFNVPKGTLRESAKSRVSGEALRADSPARTGWALAQFTPKGAACHPVDLAQPDHAGPRGPMPKAPTTKAKRRGQRNQRTGPPWAGVIIRRKVDGMAGSNRPLPTQPRCQTVGHPGDLPLRRGAAGGKSPGNDNHPHQQRPDFADPLRAPSGHRLPPRAGNARAAGATCSNTRNSDTPATSTTCIRIANSIAQRPESAFHGTGHRQPARRGARPGGQSPRLEEPVTCGCRAASSGSRRPRSGRRPTPGPR
jgi:hypothetical protein